MSRILDKLADEHEERIINVLYTLEQDVINEVTRATKGELVSQRLAIQLQPRIRNLIESNSSWEKATYQLRLSFGDEFKGS